MAVQYTESVKYRKLDSEGDYTFGHSNEFLEGLEALTQAIKTRLKVIRGEWWEGDDTALPYMTEILGKANGDKNKLDLMVIHRITDTVGVLSVTDVKSSILGRAYSFSCKVKTVYGTTTIEVNT